MKMSKYKLDIIKEVTAADESQSMLSYAFPLMRYHDRWKEINLAEDKPEHCWSIPLRREMFI